MHADFIGTPGQLAKTKPPMLMRITKSGANVGNGLGGFFPHVRRQLVRRLFDSFREQNANHNLPVKGASLPALRDKAISASAESSAAVA